MRTYIPLLLLVGSVLLSVTCLAQVQGSSIKTPGSTATANSPAPEKPVPVATTKVVMPKTWTVRGVPYEVTKIVKVNAASVLVETTTGPQELQSADLPPKVLEIFRASGHFKQKAATLSAQTGQMTSRPVATAPRVLNSPARPPVEFDPTANAPKPNVSAPQANAASSSENPSISEDKQLSEETRRNRQGAGFWLKILGGIIMVGGAIMYLVVLVKEAGWGSFFLCCIPIFGQFMQLYLLFKHFSAFLPWILVKAAGFGLILWAEALNG